LAVALKAPIDGFAEERGDPLGLGLEGFASIPEAVAEIAAGKMVVVVDSPDRENEGDLVMAAEKARTEDLNFMTKEGRGLVCATLSEERLRGLDIPPMSSQNRDRLGTAFHVSVDYAAEGATGISAEDRARTVRALADPTMGADDFRRPGHIFPLARRRHGVLQRPGHTEASADLAALAGLEGVGVICEILGDDGRMARVPELLEFGHKHEIKVVAISELIEFRCRTERLVLRGGETTVSAGGQVWRSVAFRDLLSGAEHQALVLGDLDGKRTPLVRIQNECRMGTVLGAAYCNCARSLSAAAEAIARHGCGAIVHLHRPGDERRGCKERGEPTPQGGSVGSQIVAALGVRRMKVLRNREEDPPECDGYGMLLAGELSV
jgi:3,4-dihydroxy 2-butanone 4-phosphate synthase/GTP cyclohydrolase II